MNGLERLCALSEASIISAAERRPLKKLYMYNIAARRMGAAWGTLWACCGHCRRAWASTSNCHLPFCKCGFQSQAFEVPTRPERPTLAPLLCSVDCDSVSCALLLCTTYLCTYQPYRALAARFPMRLLCFQPGFKFVGDGCTSSNSNVRCPWPGIQAPDRYRHGYPTPHRLSLLGGT